MGDSKHTNRFNKPVVVGIATLGLIMALRTSQDGDIGLGFDSGAFAAMPVSQILNKAANRDAPLQITPPPVTPLTVVATAQKTEKEPVIQGQRIATALPAKGPAIVQSEKSEALTPAAKPVKFVKTATTALATKPANADISSRQPLTTASPAKSATSLASGFQGLAGTETVYEHVSDKPAYCILGLKPGEICPDEGMVAAQIHKTYFVLDQTAKINAAQARTIIETSLSNLDLTKAGIIIVQHDKLDEMGRLMLSVVESAKGTTSTWYNPETGIETQRQIANKGGAYIYEQYSAATGKWSPVKDKSGDDLRIEPSAPKLTAGM